MKIYKKLAEFQQEVPAIFKGTSGYGYKYADWGEILKVINPLLKKHSLGFSQPLDGVKLKTIVFDTETGESIEGSVNIPQNVQLKGMNDFQVLGSAITYLRRYSLSSMLGLVTDEDADAHGTQEVKQEVNKANKTDLAKQQLNEMLEHFGYSNVVKKKAFVLNTLGKSTVENEEEANQVMEMLTEENSDATH